MALFKFYEIIIETKKRAKEDILNSLRNLIKSIFRYPYKIYI